MATIFPADWKRFRWRIFDVEDIPLCGERIVRKENITDIFFYDEKSNPYSDNRVDMKKLKAYNKYIYPLSLILNRNL